MCLDFCQAVAETSKKRGDMCNNLKEARISEVHFHDEHQISLPQTPTSYLDGVLRRHLTSNVFPYATLIKLWLQFIMRWQVYHLAR